MNTLKIECDDVRIDTSYYDSQIRIELTNPLMNFLEDIDSKEIVANHGDGEELFNAIMELDEGQGILHDYLQKSGYIFNKA